MVPMKHRCSEGSKNISVVKKTFIFLTKEVGMCRHALLSFTENWPTSLAC